MSGFRRVFGQPPGNPLAAGQSTMPREGIQGGAPPTNSGRLLLSYFTASRTETLTRLGVPIMTAAGATPTLARSGVYAISAPDTGLGGTLLAATPNEPSLFTVANRRNVSTTTTPFTLVAGRRYAVGVLVVSTATIPTYAGANGTLGTIWALAPRVTGTILGVTDLPGTITSVGDIAARVYAELLP